MNIIIVIVVHRCLGGVERVHLHRLCLATEMESNYANIDKRRKCRNNVDRCPFTIYLSINQLRSSPLLYLTDLAAYRPIDDKKHRPTLT